MRILAALALTALLASCAASSGAPKVAAAGKPAPAFTEKEADGSTLTLAALQGKAIYLNFFASWCGPCNVEAPDINALQKKYASRGVQVVGVDVLESAKKAQGFIAQHHLVYPAVVDDGTLRDQYSINGLPVHVFIDRSGIVRKIEIGELSKTEMEADIRSLLGS